MTRAEYNKRPGRSSKWISRNRREAIYNRDGHRCVWCGACRSDLCLDHAIPRKRGGTHASSNLLTACKTCNDRRQDKSMRGFAIETFGEQWRNVLARVKAARRRQI